MDKQFFEIIRNIGICNTGKRYLDKETKNLDFLIKIWKRWPEYLIEHNEEVTPLLRSYLSEDDVQKLKEHNIFFDTKDDKAVRNDTIFVCGKSDVSIYVEDWEVVKIYVFDYAHLIIDGGQNSIVNIESYNNAVVDIPTCNTGMTIYRHDNSTIHSMEGVSIIEKEMKRGMVFNGEEIENVGDYEL